MIRLNLIPESLLAAQVRRRHMRRWGIATIAAMILVAMPLGMDWVHRAQAVELDEYSGQLQAEFARVRTDWHDLSEQAKYLALRLERSQALRSKRPWSSLLAMVASCSPDQSWITSIATDPVTPSGGTAAARRETVDSTQSQNVTLDAPHRLVVEGYAVDATLPNRFVTNLKETNVFRDVALDQSTIQSVLGGEYLHFKIVCEW